VQSKQWEKASFYRSKKPFNLSFAGSVVGLGMGQGNAKGGAGDMEGIRAINLAIVYIMLPV